MNEPNKENPKASKRSKRRPPMEPLGWDEIVSQPGMGGYPSFLNGPVPLPHLQGPVTGLAPAPGVVSHPGPDPNLGAHTSPEPISGPVVVSIPQTDTVPDVTVDPEPVSSRQPAWHGRLSVFFEWSGSPAPGCVSHPGPDPNLGAHTSPEPISGPVVVSIPQTDTVPDVTVDPEIGS